MMMIELEKEQQGHSKPIVNLLITLHAFYESTKSVRLFIAPDLTVLFFNKKGLEQVPVLFGKKLKIGIKISKLLKKSDLLEAFLLHFENALEGVTASAEFLIGMTEEKEWYKIEFHAVSYEMKTAGVSVSIRNISDRKKKELQLIHQRDVINEIIHKQSHIFRSPVASILGLIALIEKDGLSESDREIVDGIELSAKRLDSVINEIVASANKTKEDIDIIN